MKYRSVFFKRTVQTNINYFLTYGRVEKILISLLPSSDVKNEVFVSSPKPCIFPAAANISYVVYEVRLTNVYLLTLSVVKFWTRKLSFFNLIQNLVRLPFPVLTGSIQDDSALLDLMLVTVRFVG